MPTIVKTFFLILISLFFFSVTSASAALQHTVTKLDAQTKVNTKIVATSTDTISDIVITIDNPQKVAINNLLKVYTTIRSDGVCQDSSLLSEQIVMPNDATTYTKSFHLTGLTPAKEYCFQYNGWPTDKFKTDVPATDFFSWPLTFTSTTGQSITIGGKIDITKYTTPTNLEVQLQFSTLPFIDENGPSNKNIAKAHNNLGTGSVEGVAADGSYYWELSSLTPNTTYYFRQVIVAKGTTTVLSTKADKFNSTSGYTPVGSVKEQTEFDAKSYHLLAPWPGLAVLKDPDLCAQEKRGGKVGPNTVCDINGFLNFAFKTLIGLTAVVLVLRLMYEGYQYMVTDVPFLKASAKSDFKTALFGLILALSAYLILNTINPKLVTNTISVASVNLGVELYSTIDPATYQKLTGQKIKAKPEYINLVDTISQQKTIDACIVKAVITVESNWVPNIIGCDENARFSDVPSRKAFVGSGIKLDGTTFSDTSTLNNCPKTIDTTKPGYGLDWRFSKGGGLMQKTLFPVGYRNPAWYEGVKQGGTYWNSRTTPFSGWQALLVPEENIKAGIDILKQGLQKCNGSVEAAFRLYGAGGTNCTVSGDLLDKSVAKKMVEYQSCKNNPSGYAR